MISDKKLKENISSYEAVLHSTLFRLKLEDHFRVEKRFVAGEDLPFYIITPKNYDPSKN